MVRLGGTVGTLRTTPTSPAPQRSDRPKLHPHSTILRCHLLDAHGGNGKIAIVVAPLPDQRKVAAAHLPPQTQRLSARPLRIGREAPGADRGSALRHDKIRHVRVLVDAAQRLQQSPTASDRAAPAAAQGTDPPCTWPKPSSSWGTPQTHRRGTCPAPPAQIQRRGASGPLACGGAWPYRKSSSGGEKTKPCDR